MEAILLERRMRLSDPVIITLIDTIREEGIESQLLKYSAIQLYRQYTPLQVFNLELTINPPSRDYTSFKAFWRRLKTKILKEFESIRLLAMSKHTTLSIPPSPIIRTARTQYTEDDFRQVEGEIGNGGNAQSIAKALMLPNVAWFMEDYEIEVESLKETLKMSGRLQKKAFKVLENLKSETNSVKEVVSKLQKRADNRWLVEGHAIEEQQRRLDERKKHFVMIKQGQSDGIKLIKELGEKLDATIIEMDMLAGKPNSAAYAHLPIECHKDVVTTQTPDWQFHLTMITRLLSLVCFYHRTQQRLLLEQMFHLQQQPILMVVSIVKKGKQVKIMIKGSRG